MIHDAHAFRGEYIDLCAQIERWAVEVIRAASVEGQPRKVPPLPGQKLKLVEELAAGDAVFTKPARARALLAQLKPYMDLRSQLAHALITVAGQGDDAVYAFDNAAAEGLPSLAGRIWLTPRDTHELLGKLKQHRKELGDQQLRR